MSGKGAPTVKEVEKRAACEKTILIYARGTIEPGDWGISVGPALQTQAKNLGWGTRAVGSAQGYGAGIADDFCVGLPGGIACKKFLEKTSSECPSSNFVLAGYSQGAMVARICAAYQAPATQARIKVSEAI
jgi:cutinase